VSLTTKQWAQLGATLAVAAAAVVGGVVTAKPNAQNVAPAASQAAKPAIPGSAPNIQPTALDTAHQASLAARLAPPASAPDSGAVLNWAGIVAVNDTTGALRSDLGWRPATQGESALGVLRCAVATEVKPRFRRVLVAPNSPPTGGPAYVWTVCSKGFHQWDSLEGVSDGRWPKP
jgi:hypothetical protein